MRTSRRIAVGCLIAALGVGAWWTTRRPGVAPAPDEATGSEDVARRPEASDPASPRRPRGGDLAGAAPMPTPTEPDDETTVAVFVAGPDGPIRGAEVRLAEFTEADDRDAKAPIAVSPAEVGRRKRRGFPPGDSWIRGPDRIATTDATGVCRFRGVRAEFGDVSASAAGFLRDGGEQRFVRRAPRGLSEVRVALLAATRLEGTVVDAGTGTPIVGAKVGFGLGDGMAGGRYGHAYVESTQSAGPDGRFTLWAPTDAASLSVEVSAADHAGAAVEVRHWRGHLDPERPVIRLPRLGAIEGVVLDPDGRPLASATVSLGEIESAAPTSDAASIGNADDLTGGKVAPPTGADGAFSFAGLPRGRRYRLRVAAEGFPSAEREVSLEFAASVARADLRLATATTIAVRVLGPDDRPFPHDVRIVVTSAGSRQERTAWNSAGRFVFDRVSPGPVGVRVVAPSGVADERTLDARAQAVAEATFHLPIAGAIRGVVVDEDGRRLEGAAVSGAGRFTRSDADGRFEFIDVAPGDHEITARTTDSDGRPLTAAGRLVVRAPADGVRVVLRRLAHVRMRVVRADGEAVSARVEIAVCEPQAHPSWGSASFTGPTGVGGGIYEFPTSVAAGTYDILVASPGFASVRRSVTFRAGEDLDLGEIRLGPGVELAGRVLDASGAPLAGAIVRALDAWDEARTAPDGSFRVSHVAPGPAGLSVEVSGAPAGRFTVEAAEGGAPCEIRLVAPGLVRGAVRGADGRPRAGVRIRFVRADGSEAPPVEATSSRLGRLFVVLPAGPWNATFPASGGRPSVLGTVDVASNAAQTLDLDLPKD